MKIEFFCLRIERYFLKDRSEEKKCRALKILSNGLLIILPVPGSWCGFKLSLIDAFDKDAKAPLLFQKPPLKDNYMLDEPAPR